jgi:hypothetical protein
MLTKNQLFEILLDWNYWDREFLKTTPRKSYEKQIERLSQTDEVKGFGDVVNLHCLLMR